MATPTDGEGIVLGEGAVPHAFVGDIDEPVLDDEDDHHLRRVLRVRPGDALTVADGNGRWRACRMGAVDSAPAPAGPVHEVPAPEPAITIGFALVKGEKPELILQKLTELGVDRIVPLVAGRSVVRPDAGRADKQHARWQRVVREAAMQSRRVRLPELAPLTTLAALQQAAAGSLAAADRGGGPPTLARPTIVVGPEGGWTDEERAGFAATVALGEQVLRAETACIAAATVLGALRAGVVAPAGPG